MKRACLLIVVPALLVALGFAQTPAASSNTDPTSIKGCLGGSDSNYTLVEDNTGHNFKITTTSADLKPHLGHDVALIGQKAIGTATSGAADNGFAVTSLNMISEHCAAAAAAPAGSISAPADTVIPPPAAAATIPTAADTTSACCSFGCIFPDDCAHPTGGACRHNRSGRPCSRCSCPNACRDCERTYGCRHYVRRDCTC
jgi:hypothetical protein